MKKQVWRLVILALVLVLVGQFVYIYSKLYSDLGKGTTHAAYPPVENFSQLVSEADVIIEGEVLRVEAGPDTVVALRNPNGDATREDRIPSQRVVVRVEAAHKGQMKAGEEIIIHRTGGEVQFPQAPSAVEDMPSERQDPPAGAPAPGDDKAEKPDPDKLPTTLRRTVPENTISVKVMDLEGDPAYSVGERVFLTLEQRQGATQNAPAETGVYQPTHPAGRYSIAGDGTLRGVIDDDVSQSVSRRTLSELQAAARGELNIPTDPQALRRRVSTGMPTTGLSNMDPLIFAQLGLVLVIVGVALGAVSLVWGRLSARRGGH